MDKNNFEHYNFDVAVLLSTVIREIAREEAEKVAVRVFQEKNKDSTFNLVEQLKRMVNVRKSE